MNAKSVRLSVQKLIALPAPQLGNFGPRTWTLLETLRDAPDDAHWPPEDQPAEVVNDRGHAILAAARHFQGLTEKKQNAVWDDPSTPGPDARADELRARLLETGWQLSWPYCIAFAEVCWRLAYQGAPEAKQIGKLITPSVMESFENFQKLERITREPKPGSIFFKQWGNKWQGHAGLVVDVAHGNVLTIEGNTSPQAGSPEAEREGDGVFAKHWPLDFTKKQSGLWLRGFVNPL